MSKITDTYDRIAPGWYNFRHHSIFRAELEALSERWERGRLLNIGCAHGPDFVPLKSGFELHGTDISGQMLKQARRYAGKFNLDLRLVEADACRLPYRDSSFDWAIAVAVYHHMMSGEDRLRAFRELYRVLKPGGEAFVTVWNRRQPRFWFRGKSLQVPWRTREAVIYRDYYLFTYSELEKLAKRAGFMVVQSYPERAYRFPLKMFSRNICLLLSRPADGVRR